MDTKKTLEIVKKEAPEVGLLIGGIATGMCGAHFAKSKIPAINNLLGDGAVFLGNTALAVLIPAKEGQHLNKLAKYAAAGMAVYGFLSGVSRLGAPVTISGIKGIGAINIPQGVKNFINSTVPRFSGASLGNADAILMYPDGKGVYQMLGNRFPAPTPMATPVSNLIGAAI